MKKTFKLQLLMKDDDESITSIERNCKLPLEDEGEQLYKICGNMYNFLVSLNIPIKDSFEAFSVIGSSFIEDDDSDEDVNNNKDSSNNPIKYHKNDTSGRQEVIQKMIDDPFAYKDFIEQLSSGDDNFKKGVFRAFLKDMYEEET